MNTCILYPWNGLLMLLRKTKFENTIVVLSSKSLLHIYPRLSYNFFDVKLLSKIIQWLEAFLYIFIFDWFLNPGLLFHNSLNQFANSSILKLKGLQWSIYECMYERWHSHGVFRAVCKWKVVLVWMKHSSYMQLFIASTAARME